MEIDSIHEIMPECSERIVLKLIADLSSSEIHYEPLGKFVEILRNRLEIEGFLSETCVLIIELIEFLKFKNKKSASECLSKILRHIRCLDIRELMIASSSHDNRLKRIQNKNVYILMGPTGSGKSSSLHFLAGSIFSTDNLGSLVIDEITNPYLKDASISSSINSLTKSIIPVIIDINQDSDDPGEAIVCDSPGFGDTNGPEVDISNVICLKKAMEECSGIKPIIVFSNLGGDRHQILIEYIKSLKNTFPNFEKDIESFSYILTKIKLEDKDSFLNSVQNAFDDLKDESCRIFIEDIMRKRSQILVLDLLKSRKEEIQSVLFDNQFIRPNLNLTFSYDSKIAIEKQFKLNCDIILNTFLHDEFDLVDFKLDELIFLVELVKSDRLNFEFSKLRSKLLELNFERSIENFNKSIESNRIISKIDLDDFKKLMDKAEKSEFIFQKLGRFSIKSKLIKNLEDKFKLIEQNMESENEEILKFSLENFKILYETFSIYDPKLSDEKYRQTCKSVYSKLEDSYGVLCRNPDHDILTNEIKNIRKIVLNYSKHFDSTNLDFSQLKEILKKNIDSKSRKILFTETNGYFEIDLEKLNSIDSYFQNILNTPEIFEFITYETIKIYYMNFLNKNIHEFTKNISDEIKHVIQGQDFDDSIKIYFKQMYFLNETESFKEYTFKIYSEINKAIKDFLKSSKNIQNSIKEFFSDSNKFSLPVNSIEFLKNFEWYDEYNQKHLYQESMSKIENLIFDEIQLYLETVDASEISCKKNGNLEKIDKHFKKLFCEQFKKLGNLFPCVKYAINEARFWYMTQVNQEICWILNEIDKISKFKNIDYDLIQSMIRFLEFYQVQNGAEASKKLTEFLSSRNKIIFDQIVKSFKNIEQYAEQNELEKASAESMIFKGIVKEFKELEIRHRDLYKLYFDEEWKNFINEKIFTISLENEEFAKLNKNILLCQVIQKVDYLFDSKEKSFEIMRIDAIKKLQSFQQKISDNCENYIKNNDFFSLKFELKKLDAIKADNSDFVNKLEVKLKELLQTASNKILVQGLNEDCLKKVEENIDLFRNAKENLEIYMKNIAELNLKELNIKQSILKSIDNFIEKNIKVNAANFNFNQVDSLITHLSRMEIYLHFLNNDDLKKWELIKENPNDLYIKRLSKLNLNDLICYPPKKIFSEANPVIRIELSKTLRRILHEIKNKSDFDRCLICLNEELKHELADIIKIKQNLL